jgi:hypothetical protein
MNHQLAEKAISSFCKAKFTLRETRNGENGFSRTRRVSNVTGSSVGLGWAV